MNVLIDQTSLMNDDLFAFSDNVILFNPVIGDKEKETRKYCWKKVICQMSRYPDNIVCIEIENRLLNDKSVIEY